MQILSFNELTWDNRAQWPDAYRYIFCILPGLFTFIFIFYFFIYQLLGRYDFLIVEQKQLLKQYQQLHREVSVINELESQIYQMKKDFSCILKKLPTKNEMPKLLESISKTGLSLGLTFQLFAPQPEVLHSFYVEIPVNITMMGTYEQLVDFFINIAHISQLITVHDFTVTSIIASTHKQSDPGEIIATKEKLIMTVTVKIYQYVNAGWGEGI